MSRLIIDITELVSWQGKLTGVPRVINELQVRFAREDKEIVFASWDAGGGCLVRTYYSMNHTEEPRPQKTSKITASLPIPVKAIYGRVKNKSSDMLRSASSNYPDVVELRRDDTLLVMADWHGSDGKFIDFLLKSHENGVKLFQIVYDLLPLVAPQYSGHSTTYLKHYVEKIYPICSILIAISENTKSDVMNWLKSNKLRIPKIEVIRLGDDFDKSQPTKPVDDQFQNFQLKGGDYILCVGTVEARKNHSLLYYTYKLAKSRNIELPKLVIVGRLGWQAENIYEFITHDPDTKDRMIVLQNTNDNELAWLYGNCLFSVYPSFYEGWGLPIAESIFYGVPCISSNTSSMQEIAGDLIYYFNPASTDECLNVIQKLQNPKELSKARSMIKKYHPVPWDETFSQLYKIIHLSNVQD